MMNLREFANGLRILFSIDFHELADAGAITDDVDGEAEWQHFSANPWRYLMAADDEQAEKIWAVMVKRGAVKAPNWEDVAVAICCGEQCDAANHGPENMMSAERYCEKFGCSNKEHRDSARAVLKFLGAAS